MPPARGGHRAPAPPAARRRAGSRAVHGAGGRPGSGTAVLRTGEGQGRGAAAPCAPEGISGGSTAAPVHASGGREGAGSAARWGRAGAEESDEKLREDGARCPLLSSARTAGTARQRGRCSGAGAEGTGGPGAPGAAAEGLQREQGLTSGRAGRSRAPRSAEGEELQQSPERRLAPVLGLLPEAATRRNGPRGESGEGSSGTARGQREGPGSGGPEAEGSPPGREGGSRVTLPLARFSHLSVLASHRCAAKGSEGGRAGGRRGEPRAGERSRRGRGRGTRRPAVAGAVRKGRRALAGYREGLRARRNFSFPPPVGAALSGARREEI